jgi:hypothetical protein
MPLGTTFIVIVNSVRFARMWIGTRPAEPTKE